MKDTDTTPSQEQELHDGLIEEDLTEREREKMLRDMAFDLFLKFHDTDKDINKRLKSAFEAGVFWSYLQEKKDDKPIDDIPY